MVNCIFSDITERDMDLLFLEEFVSSSDFLSIFTSKIGLKNAHVVEVEHSKVDVEYGESDMTVIVEMDGKRYGLLIEDKIDAKAMADQAQRYLRRGEIGKQKNDYTSYYDFIVAPKEYLLTNEEAKKYRFQISYEECLSYFESKNDLRSSFKKQQLEQAIYKQKKGYQVVEHKGVTDFWRAYAAYQNNQYPNLLFANSLGAKGANSTWVLFDTKYRNKKVKIIHKAEKGYIDIEFAGLGDKKREFEQICKAALGELVEKDLRVEQTGKAVVLRSEIPIIDFRRPFADQEKEVDEALQRVRTMYDLLDIIPQRAINKLFLGIE